MSRRTSASRDAVKEAWEREQQRILNGDGTRDWTPEQQQDIIEFGKAYDDEGKAYEGHHMKSVEAYPEYQGDTDNIQFLQRYEHQDAHHGNYQNPTNGYYDPETGKTTEFEENELKPVEAKPLTDPVYKKENYKEQANQVSTMEHLAENGSCDESQNLYENKMESLVGKGVELPKTENTMDSLVTQDDQQENTEETEEENEDYKPIYRG